MSYMRNSCDSFFRLSTNYQAITECFIDHMCSVSDTLFVVLIFLLYNTGFDDECKVNVYNANFSSTAYESILSEFCRKYRSKAKKSS